MKLLEKIKILVLSDSHGYIKPMLTAAEKESPGMIIHLGDHFRDCKQLQRSFPDIPIFTVKGNCDPWDPDSERELYINIGGVRMLVTHGDGFGVKHSLTRLINTALYSNCRIALYGHTHIPHCEEVSGLILLNPGSIRDSGSYAVLHIDGDDIKVEQKRI